MRAVLSEVKGSCSPWALLKTHHEVKQLKWPAEWCIRNYQLSEYSINRDSTLETRLYTLTPLVFSIGGGSAMDCEEEIKLSGASSSPRKRRSRSPDEHQNGGDNKDNKKCNVSPSRTKQPAYNTDRGDVDVSSTRSKQNDKNVKGNGLDQLSNNLPNIVKTICNNNDNKNNNTPKSPNNNYNEEGATADSTNRPAKKLRVDQDENDISNSDDSSDPAYKDLNEVCI